MHRTTSAARNTGGGKGALPPASPNGEPEHQRGDDWGISAHALRSDAPNAGAGAGSSVVQRPIFHEAVRFLLQKHHRAIIAAMHGSIGLDMAADRERQHAEQMLDAAIEDFEHLITVTIDRRIAERFPRNTFYLGGRL